jgi:DNA-binding transcriptional LysR family regulator
MDRLRAYEVFVTVVSRGGFARAAAALGTSPANVTRYVNELEAYLGTRLLNRTSRRLSLTERGEAVYERSRASLAEIAETEALASNAALRPAGHLRLNAPLSFGVRHLAPLWPVFLAKYPDISLEVALIDRVVDIVEEGYDLALRISASGSTAHIARKLAVSRNVLCASPDYLARRGMPERPADLAGHDCLTYAYNADEWRFLDSAGKMQAVKVSGPFHANNGDTVRAAALAGLGIAWQPTFLIGEDLRRGALVPLMPGYRLPDIDISAVYPSRRHLSAKVRVMIDFLAEAFAGVPPWD